MVDPTVDVKAIHPVVLMVVGKVAWKAVRSVAWSELMRDQTRVAKSVL